MVPQPSTTVEQVLLAVGERVGHGNISYASRMNKAVVIFLKEQGFVNRLIESGLYLNDEFMQVSPLAVPSTRITVSGVPLFIPNAALEQELKRFGRFASGFQTVSLGCKDAKLKHVQSLRRQVFMFLDSPTQTLDVSFRVKHEEGFYMVYASSGNMKCFECGDVGHKKIMCPHRQLAAGPAVDDSGEGVSGQQALNVAAPPARGEAAVAPAEAAPLVRGEAALVSAEAVSIVRGEAAVDPAGAVPPARGETALSKEDAAPSVRGEVGVSPADATALVWSVVSDRMTTTKPTERVEAGPAVSTAQNGDDMRSSELGVECVVASGEGGVEEQQCRTPAGCYGNDTNDMECDSDSDNVSVADSVSQNADLYSLEEIVAFLDDTFGKKVNVGEYFPDVEKFIRSAMTLQKVVGLDLLDGKKRYRLKKHVTGLRKQLKRLNR